MKRGFTMIELLSVIMILGILVAITAPQLNTTNDHTKVSMES